jgi:hypothetical protein
LEMDNTTNREDELIEEALKDHYESHYGPTRPADATWNRIEPALSTSVPARDADAAAPAAVPVAKREGKKQSGWMPLPPGYRKQRSPLLVARMTLVAAVVTAGLLLVALLVSALLSPQARPLAGDPTLAGTATITANEIASTVITTVQANAWRRGGENSWAYEIGVGEGLESAEEAYLKSINPLPQGAGAMQLQINLTPHRGKRVRFAADLWTEDVEGRAGLWMMIRDERGVTISEDEMRDRPLTGTQERRRYEIVMDVPQEAQYATIGAQLEGEGRIWIAGARLEIVDKTVATTGSPPPYNLDFESGLARWHANSTLPGQGSYRASADNATRHGGKVSALLESTENNTESAGLLTQGFPVGDYGGKRIRISAYVKADKVKARGALIGSVDERTQYGKRTYSFDDMSDRPVQGTIDWTQQIIVLDVPPEATFITIGALLFGEGKLWVDDIKVEVVGPDVAVTGYATGRGPANLSFENGLEQWYTWEGRAEADRAIKHSEGASLRLTATESASGVNAQLTQYFLSNLYRNRKVRVTAYMKTSDVMHGAHMQVMTVDVRNYDLAQSPLLSGSHDWTRLEATIAVPDDFGRVAIVFNIEGEGTIWIDDVTVEEVE